MDPDPFPTYERLWLQAEGEGVWVHYAGAWPGENRNGYFDPREDEKLSPMLAIVRPYYKEPSETPSRDSNAPIPLARPDLLEELITLAHEYGHFQSYKGRTARAEWKIYDAIAHSRDEIAHNLRDTCPDGLSDEQALYRFRHGMGEQLGADACDRILREESLAWTIGRETLATLGWTDFERFDQRERDGLHMQRYWLGLEDGLPSELAATAASE